MLNKRLAIFGATGFVGRRLCALLSADRTCALGRREMAFENGIKSLSIDLLDKPEKAYEAIRDFKADIILYLAALTQYSPPEEEFPAYKNINTTIPVALAELAAEQGALFVYTSTDLVFDGKKPPYQPLAKRTPLSIYGQTKAEAETALENKALIVRFPLMYGKGGSFFQQMLTAFQEGKKLRLFTDEYRTPALCSDAVKLLIKLLNKVDKDTRGTFNFGGPDRITRFEMGELMAKLGGFDASLIEATKMSDVFEIPRSADLTLDSSATYEFLNCQPVSIQEGIAQALNEK